jgi:hypothetical protein
MGTFAETPIVDYSLSTDQGKQTSIFLFRLQQTNRSWPFPFSVFSQQMESAIFCQFRFVCVCIYFYSIVIFTFTVYAAFTNGNGKRKPRPFPLIRLPFADHANGSLSFVRLFTEKQTEEIHLQMN